MLNSSQSLPIIAIWLAVVEVAGVVLFVVVHVAASSARSAAS